MRNIKRFIGLVTMVALLFTSCSKEEDEIVLNDSEKATLSFGTLLNDLVTNKASLKQAVGDIPACSDEAPAFVEVVLSGPTNVGTMLDPLVVAVNPTPGDYDNDGDEEYFTEESVDLELEPGDYSLEFFAVYDGDPNVPGTNRIWIAPMDGGSLAGFVTSTLPMDISLGAGVKKYVDVEVLCFDDRLVNEYGYLFFDIESTRAYEFCFFANYCDENGRHFPAAYTVNVWLGNDNQGTLLYSETNTTGIGNPNDPNNEDEPYAAPLCLALPNLDQFEDDEDYLYYEVTLSDWVGVYGEVSSTMIPGNLSRDDIEDNFDGENINYEHIRFGCGDDGETPADSDDDGIPDSIDECPGTEDNVEVDEQGCAVNGETDSDGDGVVDSEDNCPNTEEGIEVDEEGCPVTGETDSDGDGVPDSIDECPGTSAEEEVDSVGCPIEETDQDGDGVPDSVDECPETPEAFRVNELGCPVYDIEGPDAACFETHLEGQEEEWIMISDPSPDFATLLTLEGVGGTSLANVTIRLEDGDWAILLNTTGEYQVDDYIIRVWNGNPNVVGWVFSDENIAESTGEGPDVEIFQPANLNYPFYVMIKANICPTE